MKKPYDFKTDLQTRLSEELRAAAVQRGITPESLLELAQKGLRTAREIVNPVAHNQDRPPINSVK